MDAQGSLQIARHTKCHKAHPVFAHYNGNVHFQRLYKWLLLFHTNNHFILRYRHRLRRQAFNFNITPGYLNPAFHTQRAFTECDGKVWSHFQMCVGFDTERQPFAGNANLTAWSALPINLTSNNSFTAGIASDAAANISGVAVKLNTDRYFLHGQR